MTANESSSSPPIDRWPELPLESWSDTCDTLHLWTQIVGKVALKLRPFLNEWWQIAFQMTPRGLTTGNVPFPGGVFSFDFDFIEHSLVLSLSDGRRTRLPLAPRSVASFYREIMAVLWMHDIVVSINPQPVEIPGAIRCDEDELHAAYDPEAVRRWWQIMLSTERVLQRYRSQFVGKSSPTQFFWGSFDLNQTRFSGRPAPEPVGAPRFMRLAEDQENAACGFWPGNVNMGGVTLGEPAFYAYIYPEPEGYRQSPMRPEAAYFNEQLGEFILPYDAVQRSSDPEQTLLEFFQSTYEAAVRFALWDRAALERPSRKGSNGHG